MNVRRTLIFYGTVLAGIACLGFYSVKLSYEELKTWQRLEVVFDNVGGLKEEDDVQILGSRQGRVNQIQLYRSKQKVLLDVEPGLVLYEAPPGRPELESYAFEIVPKNALGTMVVRVTPGDPEGIAVDMTQLFKGTLREGVGLGEPTPGRREALRDLFATAADRTYQLRDPESGVAGALLFDRQRALDLELSLSELDDQWAKADQALAEIEAEQGIGRFLLSTDTLVALGDTIAAARDMLGRIESGLDAADEGDEASGGWLGDPVRAAEVRQVLARQADAFAEARRGNGLLGRALDPELGEQLNEQLEPLRVAAADGVEERGLLGVLSGDAQGEWTRRVTSNLPRSLERIRTQLQDPDGGQQLKDGLGNVDDALVNFRRGMTYVKRGILPVRTQFANALFMVF